MGDDSARSRRPWDRTTVALEASTNAWALADLLGRHAGLWCPTPCGRERSPRPSARPTTSMRRPWPSCSRPTTCRPVWQPDEATRRLRRLTSHRAGLVHDRTAVRNRVAAVLSRHLVRAPMTDVFGVRGRAWLAALDLPPDERLDPRAAVQNRRRPVRADHGGRAGGRDRSRRRPTRPAAARDPRASVSSSPPRSSRSSVTSTASSGRPSSWRTWASTRGSASPATDPRCAGTSAARARPMRGDCCARPPTRPSAHPDHWPDSTPAQGAAGWRGGDDRNPPQLAVLVWHLLAKDEDCRFDKAARTTSTKQRSLDRLAGRAGTRPSQRGATGSSHDQGRARLRGGHDPHDPALRQAIDRVHPDSTSPSGA